MGETVASATAVRVQTPPRLILRRLLATASVNGRTGTLCQVQNVGQNCPCHALFTSQATRHRLPSGDFVDARAYGRLDAGRRYPAAQVAVSSAPLCMHAEDLIEVRRGRVVAINHHLTHAHLPPYCTAPAP